MRRFALTSLIAAAAATWLLPLNAQQPAMPVVGILSTASAESRGGEQFAAFYRGLGEAGYIENQNVTIQYRWADDDYARLPALAAELVHLPVAVLVAAGGHVSALAAHDATKDIPIVFTTVTDPIKSGLVASLNKPGGNATGTAGLTSELDAKRLELLHELMPAVAVIGVLVNPQRPGLENQSQELQAAADKLKLKLEVQRAATEQEIDTAFETFAQRRVEALLVTADPFFNNRRDQVVALAAHHAIPAIYQWREFVAAGGLISYGPGLTDAYHQAGVYTGRILKGDKPADLPVVQPTQFQLVINSQTAKQLGVALSPTFLARADEVIE
jgi:putative tryptophan/tyrosine transport system substrate-binding protein